MAGWLLDLELGNFGLSEGLTGSDSLASFSLPGFRWKWRLGVSGVAHTLRQILQIHQQLVNLIISV